MLSSMCQHVARLQFDSCAEKQPVWNSHDGLTLRCLDQCHGVRVFVPMAQAPPKAGAKKML